MTTKEKNRLFVEIYKENQKFIDKITITAALGSIPISIGFIDNITKICCCERLFFVVANCCAATVVFAQIIGAVFGKKTCNAGLENDGSMDCYSAIQGFWNTVVNIAFCVMVACYLEIIISSVYGG